MTDAARALPSRSPGPQALPDRAPGTAAVHLVPPQAAARTADVTRTGVATRRPVHVVVAVGMTAGLYALSLAGVSGLQSAADTQLAADRAPAAGAVAGLRTAHDAMEADLGTLTGAYAHAASEYAAITRAIAGHEQSLATLGKQVQAAAGLAAALSVPRISLAPGGSGGSWASSSGAAAPAQGRGVPALNVAPLPVVSSGAAAPASRPVVNACTTASGKPC